MDQRVLIKLFTFSFFLLSSSSLFGTVLAQVSYDVRLVGGSDPAEGRVEIFYSSEWGTVCDDTWGVEESQVMCQQLGYGGSLTLAPGQYPTGSGTIWLDDVSCVGDETSIAFCVHRPWGNSDCSHIEDVGVRCYISSIEGALRLAGDGRATYYEGRVEISHNGEWGTVCDDAWDLYDGAVACRQMGYAGVNMVYDNAQFGSGSGRIWLDDMQCSGSELTLAACLNDGWGNHNCDHSEDAGVSCAPYSVEGAVRLVYGPRASKGRLEIYHNDQWGTVCDDSWDSLDSEVVCRQLGYEGDTYFTTAAEGYEEATGPIWLDGVRCYGYEDRLEYCSDDGWGVHDCSHAEDVGVQCSADDLDGGAGLSGGEIAGIVIGSLVGIFLFYVCCIRTKESKTPSQEPTVDPLGDESREGTVELDHAHPTDLESNVVPDLPPPSYDDIGKYTSFSVPGSEGVYPPPPPTAPYVPPTAPYPPPIATYSTPTAPYIPPTAPHPPPNATRSYSTPIAPYPPPSPHYVPPSFPGATVMYHYPSGDSGAVPSAPPVPSLPPSALTR